MRVQSCHLMDSVSFVLCAQNCGPGSSQNAQANVTAGTPGTPLLSAEPLTTHRDSNNHDKSVRGAYHISRADLDTY